MKQLCDVDLGKPLHSLVLLGKRTHDLEKDFIRDFAVEKATFDQAWDHRE